jgi:oligopeptide/dipeptide ABC transporter ATP-binding protein
MLNDGYSRAICHGRPPEIHSSPAWNDRNLTGFNHFGNMGCATPPAISSIVFGGQVTPSLIICDEPISALDVSIQAQIINLLEELQENLGLTYSNRIAVMYPGRIVEIASSEESYESPLQPYTQALLSAIPIPNPELDKNRHRIILKGEVPNPADPPAGCHFYPRCEYATGECQTNSPRLKDIGNGHLVACFRTSDEVWVNSELRKERGLIIKTQDLTGSITYLHKQGS